MCPLSALEEKNSPNMTSKIGELKQISKNNY